MSSDKPVNAMYGTKMKLDLDKLKKNKKDDEKTTDDEVVKVDVKPNEEPVETKETVVEDVSLDESEDVDVEDVSTEEAEQETSSDNSIIDELKAKIKEKETKLANQSGELNYLTNKIIPNLKSENKQLNSLKIELSEALESSTKKYFDQLDINADLSEKLTKLGAESALNKVRTDKLDSEMESIKEKYESKISEFKEKLNSVNVSEVNDLKDENKKLTSELSDLTAELDKVNEENSKLTSEVNELRQEIIEIGNYKEEVDSKNKETISNFESEISSLKTDLKVKQSNYDKLSNDSQKTISDLRKEISKLEEALEKESNKGLFNRFK